MKEIIDGIINKALYESSKFKIMWVLKEANVDSKDWDEHIDICEAFDKDEHKRKNNALSIPTFRKMIYATFGILNPEIEWSDVPYANEDAYEAIKHIAYVNINKFPAGAVSDHKSIKQAYVANRQALIDQIRDCDPNIIIFGGTWSYFETEDLNSMGWDISSSETKYVDELHIGTTTTYFTVSPTKVCISAYHPSYPRIADKAYWFEIKTAVQKWQQEMNI
jgi:hypothetical protein